VPVTRTFEMGKDWTAGGGGFGARGGGIAAAEIAAAPLVFVGNGYVINKTNTNPYQGLDVRGKVMVVAGQPAELAAQAAAAHAVLVLGAVVVLHALGAAATAGVADVARRALGVGLAAAATIANAQLARLALRSVAAVADDGIALAVAALEPFAAVLAVAALLALASNTILLRLAVLVRVAGRVLRLARDGGGKKSGHEKSQFPFVVFDVHGFPWDASRAVWARCQ